MTCRANTFTAGTIEENHGELVSGFPSETMFGAADVMRDLRFGNVRFKGAGL